MTPHIWIFVTCFFLSVIHHFRKCVWLLRTVIILRTRTLPFIFIALIFIRATEALDWQMHRGGKECERPSFRASTQFLQYDFNWLPYTGSRNYLLREQKVTPPRLCLLFNLSILLLLPSVFLSYFFLNTQIKNSAGDNVLTYLGQSTWQQCLGWWYTLIHSHKRKEITLLRSFCEFLNYHPLSWTLRAQLIQPFLRLSWKLS